MDWDHLSDWWRAEVVSDPAYQQVVTPLLLDMLRPEAGSTYLDLGCGEGQVMLAVAVAGGRVLGIDLSENLISGLSGVVLARLPGIPLRDSSVDGVYSVLTLEHVEDHETFFAEAARVTKADGTMTLVVNHPIWTAPGATPISDQCGEVLWRPGEYFSIGSTEMPAGDSTVVFHHRSMAMLLNAAANSGWALEQLIEQPHHDLTDQAGIPRLLACQWRLPRSI